MIVVIAYVLAILIVEAIAPKYVALVIAIANFFVPDLVPVIDEALGTVIALKRLSGS